MADPISDERLRELSQGATIYGHERNAIAAELLAARAELERLRADAISARDDLAFLDDCRRENQQLRAEVERLRSRVGWLDHLDTAEGRAMHATEAVRVEVERLRADLREAMELLDDVTDQEPETAAQRWLVDRVNALLARHKEANQ